MAWKWIQIGLNSWMVVLMDMVLYVQFLIYLGLKGDPNFLDLVIFCFGVEISLYE
jgi:hypothetical protein